MNTYLGSENNDNEKKILHLERSPYFYNNWNIIMFTEIHSALSFAN
jgi:hypothetical protein